MRQGMEGSPKASRQSRPERSGALEHPTREAGDAQIIIRLEMTSEIPEALGKWSLKIARKSERNPKNVPEIVSKSIS